jgi:hypothetical protein
MKNEKLPLSMPEELVGEVRRAAKKTGLSMAEIVRQSMTLGLARLLQEPPRKEGRLTNVEPLPDEVLEKLYREREDDEESIRRFIAAQPMRAE